VRVGIWVTWAVLLWPASAAAQALAPEALGVDVPIEDPSGRALAKLRSALRRARRGEGRARLLFYGASHTSSDQYTGYLRRRLQARFGNAGLGFVLPVQPFAYYAHRGVHIENGTGWQTLRVRGRERAPDAYGVSGVALTTDIRTWAAVEPVAHDGPESLVARFEIFFLSQPGGGHMELRVDGQPARRVATASRHRRPSHVTLELVEEGFHRLEIRTEGDGSVRLFGVNMEGSAPGVIVDSMGIPGSRAFDQLPWNADVQTEYLRRLAPDLIVLAYGTNESALPNLSSERYGAELRQVIERVRRAVPEASCLLVGPSEWSVATDDGWAPRESIGRTTETQRRTAAVMGCGFFDLIAFQGGPGSMHAWVTSEPPMALGDHVHYTAHGHRRLAEALEHALLGNRVAR